MEQQMVQVVSGILSAYGQKSPERVAIYAQTLIDDGFTPEIVRLAGRKLLNECKFVPTVADIVGAIKSLKETVDPASRDLDWSEVWTVILRQITRGENKFDRPEIAELVKRYGWHNIAFSEETQLPVIQAQLRQMYEKMMKRKQEDRHNTFLMGGNPMVEQGIKGLLKTFMVLIMLMLPVSGECFTPLPVDLPAAVQEHVFNTAQSYGLDFYTVMAVIEQESTWRSDLVSPTNDYGLMQINTINHKRLREKLGVTDFLDPYQNITAGCYMLAELYKTYITDHAVLMCYNCGEGAALGLMEDGIYSTGYSRAVIEKRERLAGL